jgi:hypothetical protein
VIVPRLQPRQCFQLEPTAGATPAEPHRAETTRHVYTKISWLSYGAAAARRAAESRGVRAPISMGISVWPGQRWGGMRTAYDSHPPDLCAERGNSPQTWWIYAKNGWSAIPPIYADSA